MSIIKSENTRVNNYTGTAKIPVNIFTFSLRDIDIPVSLEYDASGIKLQEVSGPVGLGWKLNSGGSVTRIVKGIPDESADGYCGTNNRSDHLYNGTILYNFSEYLEKVTDKEWDSEPDLFYYSLPTGEGGMFVLDKNGTPVLIPYNGCKITKYANLSKWLIINTQGQKFYFGETTNSKETTKSKISDESITIEAVTSWHLTKISTPRNENITFDYNKYTANITYKYSYKQEKKDLTDGACCDEGDTETNNKDIEITVVNPTYISAINCSKGKINFKYKSRNDIVGLKALDSILVENINYNVIKRFGLQHDYFTSPSYLGNIEKRLRLNRITESNASQTITLREFLYNSTVLPSRESPEFDSWGYYNNSNATTFIPEFTDKYDTYHSGADRTPNENATKACLLQEVRNIQLGSCQKFEYEINDYYENSVRKLAGGLRIYKIHDYLNYSDATPENTIEYDYNESGQIKSKPKHATSFIKYCNAYLGVCEQLIRFSHSIIDLFEIDGFHIGYSHVTVTNLGSIDYYYTNFNNYPNKKDSLYYHILYAIPMGGGGWYPRLATGVIEYETENYPFPQSYRGWNRGFITKEIMKNTLNQTVKETNYFYEEPTLRDSVLSLLLYEVAERIDNMFYFYYYGYSDYGSANRLALDKVVETNYLRQADASIQLIKDSTLFDYNLDYNCLTKETRWNSRGQEYEITYTYPFNYIWGDNYIYDSQSNVFKEMVDSNMVSIIIERTQIENNKAISSDFNSYSIEANGAIVPASVNKLEITAPLTIPLMGLTYTNPDYSGEIIFSKNSEYKSAEIIYDEYGNYGNLLETHKRDNSKTVFLWDNTGAYIMAKLENASYSQVSSQNGKSCTYSSKTLYNNLKNLASDAFITTYTHEPILGITEQTNPNGVTTYYYYDDFGRLEYIKNDDEDLLRKYEYNYANQ